MSKRGRPRKAGTRHPNGELREERIEPTVEMVTQRAAVLANADPLKLVEFPSADLNPLLLAARGQLSIDHPVEVMYARRPCELRRHGEEDMLEAKRRCDAAMTFANLAWHVFGQPFPSVDERHRRFVAPSITTEDADEMRQKAPDSRTPEERAEDVRVRYEAMLSLVRRGTIREWVLRQVVQYGQPISRLARNPSKRYRLRMLLLDALDLIGDSRAVRRAEDGIRASRQTRRVSESSKETLARIFDEYAGAMRELANG